MAEQFRVGDIVECVDAKPLPGTSWPGDAPIEGALYTVSGIGFAPNGTLALWLKELRRPRFHEWGNVEPGYGAFRFRLIHRPRAEFLTDLLAAPVDAPKKTEDA